MHPIGMADRTQKNPRSILLEHSVWLALPIGGEGHLTLAKSSVHLAYFHTNRLLTGHYITETEIR